MINLILSFVAQSITFTTSELAVSLTFIAGFVTILIYVVRVEIQNYVKSTVSESGKDQSKFRKEIYDKMDADREKFTALMMRVDRDITTLQLTQNSSGEKMETVEKTVEKLDNKFDDLVKLHMANTTILQQIAEEVKKR